MKLDYEQLKDVLEHVENASDGFSRQAIDSGDYKESDERFAEFLNLAYHYEVLIDNGFIKGKVISVPSQVGDIPTSIDFRGLTLSGNQLLEAMRNNTLWEKIKSGLSALGIESLKQIPALATKVLIEL